jgi:hypothetical protein
LDPHHYILLCSNEPAISEQIVSGSLDRSTGFLTFRSQESEALRAALRDYFIAGAIFDLNYSDDSLLEVIGQVQKVCRNRPLICISARLLAGHTLSQPNRTFYYAHSTIPPFALRKMLQQPTLSEPMNYQGPLQTRTLSEVVQLLQFAGLSGRIIVWSELQRGDLWVHRGQIVHAETNGRQGHAAALAMFAWPRGTFRFQPGRPPTQTIALGPHYLLSDPVRRSLTAESQDEKKDSRPPAMASEELMHSAGSPMPDLERSTVESLDGILSQSSPPSALSAIVSVSESSSASPLAIGELRAAFQNLSGSVEPGTPAAATPVPISALLVGLSTPTASIGDPLAGESGLEEQGLEHSINQSWQQLSATELREPTPQEDNMAVTANTVKDALSKLELTVEGFIGAAVADADSGMCIGTTGGASILNMEVAAAANTEVVRSKRKAMKALNLRDEIEDILITLGKQYHLIRPLRARPTVFIYLALDRGRANLAMARYTLADAERDLGV